jgi:protein-S-isoprenylcysteine O-methyltransferase Ste14
MNLSVLLRAVLFLGISVALPFAGAGRLNLPFFWAFFGIVVMFWVIMLTRIDPELMQERIHPGPGGVDRGLRLMILPVFAALLVLAGLDAGRYGWSHVPIAVQYLGLALVTSGYALSSWAVHVNRFFSPVVRIQSERGHHLIMAGPYAHIRHPGYAGSLLTLLGSGLALGSWWATLCGVVAAGLILRRAVIEDRFLHTQLDGYGPYAQRVRYRVLPGIW